MVNIDETTQGGDTVILGGDEPVKGAVAEQAQPMEEMIPQEESESEEVAEKGKNWVIYPAVLVMLVAVGGVAFFLVNSFMNRPVEKLAVSQPVSAQPERAMGAGVEVLRGPQDVLVEFEPFVIPYPSNSSKTYVYLKVSIQVADKGAYSLIEANKPLCRGIIYDIVKREIARKGQTIAFSGELENSVTNELRMIISGAGIKRVYFTNSYSV